MMMDQSSSSCSSTSHCLPSLPSKASMSGRLVHVDFPEVPVSLLESLNQQRLEGQLCDLSIQVQGQEFRAHRCVLAASSPYFHDQVLLKNVSSVVLPSVMDPLAFESVLGSAYTGRLSMLRDELINYVTVGSFLQMWHVVDKCTELLREGRGLLQSSQPPSSEQQSPSSTNYCSPPEGAGEAASQQQQQQGHQYSSGSAAGHSNKYCRGDAREAGHSPPQDSDVIAGSPPSSDQQRWPVGRPSSSIRSLALPLQRSQYPQPSGFDSAGYADELALTSSSGSNSRSRPRLDANVGFANLRAPGLAAGLGGRRSRSRSARSRYRCPEPLPSLSGRLLGRGRGRRGKDPSSQEGSELLLTCEEDGGGMERHREEEEGGGMLHSDEGRGGDDVEVGQSRSDSLGEMMLREAEEMMARHGHQTRGWSETQPQLMGAGAGGHAGLEQPSSLAREEPEESEPDESQSFPYQSQYHRSRIRHAQTHQNPLGLHLSPYEPGLHPSSSSAPPSNPSPGPADQVPFCESSQDFVSTYDEIEEGTGQVSQRPLLAPPPSSGEQQEGGGFPGVADTPPLAGAPYTGKVHLCHCGKAYTLKSMRDRHVKMQHLNLRPFACPVCAKTFKMKHHLTKHLKTHAGLQPFECQLCGKKLMWRDSFLRHRSHCERLAAEEIAASTAGVKEEEEEEEEREQEGDRGTLGYLLKEKEEEGGSGEGGFRQPDSFA
ncbi:zinc finger and BTB domain-containing protein 22-like [Acipenser ruthenus]|uniref:zinc finger and BTB domain-containing protein 22-like n=1 Tax=Acipenser ruthenus TaxID=7906 RepID=UPI0027416E4A|nr:zinc finger and BTB domain-containing protein 22-like [Acipenser ruthenus]